MPAKVKRRPAALKKSTAKSAVKKSKSASDDEPRKSRVGFKNVGMLAESLSPFVEKRFFSNYTTDRAIKSMDKKKPLFFVHWDVQLAQPSGVFLVRTKRLFVCMAAKYSASDSRLYQGIFNSCRQLSPTWNFPDTIIKRALLAILKREDWSYEYFAAFSRSYPVLS